MGWPTILHRTATHRQRHWLRRDELPTCWIGAIRVDVKQPRGTGFGILEEWTHVPRNYIDSYAEQVAGTDQTGVLDRDMPMTPRTDSTRYPSLGRFPVWDSDGRTLMRPSSN
jgi:hypothetical protein